MNERLAANFAELHRLVAFGKSGGKIIWQPRISCWVEDKRFAGQQLPAPFTDMDYPAIYRELNCSPRIYEYNFCFKAIEHPAVKQTQRQINSTDTEITITTPVGKQIAVHRKSPNSSHHFSVKWEVSSEDELKVATWRTENTTWKWDQQTYDSLRIKWGDLGAPTIFMPRVNIQDLFINTMGTQNAIYAVYDWAETVASYFKAMDECHDRLIEIINASPIEIINFGDNLHCGTLTPGLFRKYVLPAYQKRCERLHAAGKFVHSHWDGDTRSLLPFACETGLDGIEAITPQPQGDVTLEEVKEALGDKLFLIDGLPAILFDDIFPESMLEEFTHNIIRMFAPRLILGISDEISSTGNIDRIRLVGKIVDNYNNDVVRRQNEGS